MARAVLNVTVDLDLAAKVREGTEQFATTQSEIVARALVEFFEREEERRERAVTTGKNLEERE